MSFHLVVTGTDTGVGKTILTAAIAAAATQTGLSVAAIKPVQTGEDDDAAEVYRLAQPAQSATLARFGPTMSPVAAARQEDRPTIAMTEVIEAVARFEHDLVLIEGVGGLLVPLGEGDWTIADLAVELDAAAVVVVRSSLGTLNHTALTLEALRRRDIAHHVVIGSFAVEGGRSAVDMSNLHDLTRIAGRLAGAIPPNVGQLPPEVFQRQAPEWLTGRLYGKLHGVA